MTPAPSRAARLPTPAYESMRRSEAGQVTASTPIWMRDLVADLPGPGPTPQNTPVARKGAHAPRRAPPAAATTSWSPPTALGATPNYSATSTGTMFTRREKDVRPFDGNGDLYDYLNYFMKVSKLNRWDYMTCGLQLGTSLTGKASEVLTTMPEDEAEDFTCLVRALVRRFRPHGQDSQYSVALMGRSWHPEKESVTDYCHDLRRLARQAYPAQGVSECILVDLFKKGLNHEMQQQINIQQPKDLDTALATALAMEPFHKGTRGHKKPANPDVVSVAAVSTGNSNYRGRGRGNSYSGRKIPAAHMESYQKWKANRCFLCFEVGHYRKDCPKRPETSSEPNPRPRNDEGATNNDLN